MRDAIADVLPFTAGMIATPFAVIAVAVLLVSEGGMRKALAFVAGFAILSFLFCLGFAQLIGGRADGDEGEQPSWVHVVTLLVGVLMLLLAFGQLRSTLRHHSDTTTAKPPAWIAVADRMSVGRSGGLGAVLDLNPVNLSMMLAAAAALGAYELPPGDDAVVSAGFAAIGSLGVLAPVLIAVLPGLREKVPLRNLRQWLVGHGSTIECC